jgi:hypothetical protein
LIVVLIGQERDNGSALSWVEDEKCRSAFAQIAFSTSFPCLHRNIKVSKTFCIAQVIDPLTLVSFDGFDVVVE